MKNSELVALQKEQSLHGEWNWTSTEGGFVAWYQNEASGLNSSVKDRLLQPAYLETLLRKCCKFVVVAKEMIVKLARRSETD
jgi:hypothetical protein